MDKASISITFHNLRPLAAKSIYALVDADLDISGVTIGIRDIQVRHKPGGGTSIHLPTHKDERGSLRASVTLPNDLSDAIADKKMTRTFD